MFSTITPKRLYLSLLAVACYMTTLAQVGIGTVNPQGGSLLDITSQNQGLLIPRVSISDLSTIDPIIGGSPVSLLVYNTDTITGEGFHYWDGNAWVPILDANTTAAIGDDTNLSTDDLTQDPETRTYDLNEQVLSFINGALGINTTTPDGDFEAVSNENHEAYRFVQTNGTTGQIDVFTIEDQDVAGGGQDESSVLKVIKTGSINAGANGYSLVELTSTGADPGDNKYYISGHTTDEGAPLWGVDLTDNDYWSEGGIVLGVTGAANGTYSGGNFRVEFDGDTGIGTITPDASAQLDLAGTNKGILINRVALTATNTEGPISNPATGLMVFNTATASTGTTGVFPGFYYWNGNEWVAFSGTNGGDWSLEGNDGTDPTVNFIGTKENTDFVLRTNDQERVRISGETGALGIGRLPFDNVSLSIENFDFGILSNITSTGVSLFGVQNGTGQALVADNNGGGIAALVTSNGIGVQASTTAANTGTTINPAIIGLGTAANGSTGLFAATSQIATTESSVALRAVAGSTTSITPIDQNNVGIAVNATDLGLAVTTENAIDIVGDSDAATFQTNFTGIATDIDARDPQVRLAGFEENVTVPSLGNGDTFYGAFLYSGGVNNGSFAYAGARHDGTNYKIIGNGVVSTVVEDAEGNSDRLIMFAPEAPEVLFEDYGTGQLINGEAQITIDPIFSQNIQVDKKHPLKVFIQLEGDCNGVYVTNKSANGFTVKELQKGKANVSFSWHIVANRKDEISNTGERSEYSDLRFPKAPQPKLSKGSKALELENPERTVEQLRKTQ